MSTFNTAIIRSRMRGLANAVGLTGLICLAGVSMPKPAAASPVMGVNVEGPNDYSALQMYADIIKQGRHFGSVAAPWDEAAAVDANGWPTTDAGIVVIDPGYDISGTYSLTFTGQATLSGVASTLTFSNQVYNSTTNTTTANVIAPAGETGFNIAFSNTQRTSGSGTNTGVTNVQLIRPGYPANGSTLFTTPALNLLSKFSTLRFMDFSGTNANPEVNWTDRRLPGVVTYHNVNNLKDYAQPWEYAIELANAANRDMYINIPEHATDAYITSLANLIKSGDTVNGVVYPALNANLNVYIEWSNEVWNGGFQQCNDDHADAIAEVNAGGSPLNYDGETNSWTWAWRRIAKRIHDTSQIFRTVFGDAAMPGTSATPRIRPVLMWQYANAQNTADNELSFLFDYYDNIDGNHVATAHAPGYFLYGAGGATYYNSNNDTGSTGQTATAAVSGGAVTTVTVTNGGSGYASPPAITFSGGGGSGAAATTTVSGGVVTGITITSGGSGYLTGNTEYNTWGGGGVGFTFTLTVSGGAVTGGTVTNGGSGYTSAPNIGIYSSGGSDWLTGTGTNATATATVSGGVITGITVTNGGTGYTSVPTVNIDGNANAIYSSGIPNTGYASTLNAEANWAKAFGLKDIAYEGGWGLGNGNDTPAEQSAHYDTRSEQTLINTETTFQQAGGDLNILYASSGGHAWTWGMTNNPSTETPLYLAVDSLNSTTAASPTNGVALAATGSTTIAANTRSINDGYSGLPAGAAEMGNGDRYEGFLVISPAAATYQVNLSTANTAAGGQMTVFVDGVSAGALSVPNTGSASTYANTASIPVALSAGLHGVVVVATANATTSTPFAGNFGSITFTNGTSSSPPAAPTALTAAANYQRVVLNWTGNSQATSYSVYRGTTAGGESATAIATGIPSTSYTDLSVTNGTTYYYKVTAVNSAGASGYSNEASGTPVDNTGHIIQTSTAPVIDGTVDAIWSNATAYPASKLFNGPIPTGQTFNGTWKAMWDSTNLYVLFQITNNETLVTNSTSPWQGDDVELYVDATDAKPTTYGGAQFQYELGYGLSAAQETKHSPGSLTGVHYSYKAVSGGWVAEASIPWTTLGVTPAANNLIGFDADLVDGFNAGSTKLFWWDTDNTDWQNPASFGTGLLQGSGGAPAAPTGLSAAAGNTQVALSWTASTGATSYNVLRSTVSGSGYASVATGIATTAYTNTGLTNGTAYYFVVTATNASGTSGNSNQASATPHVAAPPAPTGLTATAGNTQVALSWTANTGATSYNVLRSTVSGSGYASVATGIATTSYTNTGLTNGTTYYFVVTATNAGGTSGNSNQASATPQVSGPPAPTGLTTSAGSTQALVFWNASTGATSYNLLRSTTSGSGYASVASGLSVTFYDNTGLTNGTVYYYVAQAVNAGGTSPNSAQASASPALAPQAQVAFAATAPVIDGTVDAIWSSATAYSINNINNYGTGTIKSNADLSGTFQTLWDSTNLYVLVTVTDDVLLKYVTNPWDADTIEVMIDADHNGGTAYDANDFQYFFPWNSATIVETKHSPASLTGVTFAQTNISGGYRIEAKIPWTTLTVTPAANNLIGVDVHIDDADTTAGTRDSKRAWNDTTDQAWTNPSVFGTGKLIAASAPPAPTGLTATPGNAQVALSWTASSGATSYSVYRGTTAGGESGTAIATGIATTTYTNTGLTNGTHYYYTVKAVNASGTSGASNEANATPIAGSLMGSNVGWPASPNLTTEGTSDWAHWGYTSATSFDHKSAGGSQISNATVIGGGSVFQWAGISETYTWSDGTPDASASTQNGIGVNAGTGSIGFSFTVPAGTTPHTLHVYVGNYNSTCTFTAHLSDGSAADYTANITEGIGALVTEFTLTYNAASAGKTLTVTWATTSTGAAVYLESATLI